MTGINVAFGFAFLALSLIPLAGAGLGRTRGFIGFVTWAMCIVTFVAMLVLSAITFMGKLL